MGITRGQLKRLGFKDNYKTGDLIYKVNEDESLILKKGKTVIFFVLDKEDIRYSKQVPLVHLQYTTASEMLNYLKNVANGDYITLKEQIEVI